MKRNYSDLFDLLGEIEGLLSKERPPELPPENTPEFWEAATRLEFSHRTALTEKIRLALTNGLQSVATWTPAEAWLYRRRAEWAIQIAIEAARRRIACTDSPQEFLMKFIVEGWSEDGAIAFWNHAMERDGKPHPEVSQDVLRILS